MKFHFHGCWIMWWWMNSWSLPPKNGKLNAIEKHHPFWMKVGWLASSMNDEVGDDGWTSSMKIN
jgi:hypothetical protein